MFKYNNLSEKYEEQIKEILKNNNSDFIIQKIDKYFFIKDKNKMAIISVKEAFFDKNGVIIRFLASTCESFQFNNFLQKIFGDFYTFEESDKLFKTIDTLDGYIYPINTYYCNNKDKIMLPIEHLLNENLPVFDSNKVSYNILDKDEYKTFIMNNYLKDGLSFTWITPNGHFILFGFEYSEYPEFNHNCKYLIASLLNNNGKKIMVGIIKYKPQKYIVDEKEYTFISYAEVNYFYRRKGLFKGMVNFLLDNIEDKYLSLSPESIIGKMIVSRSTGNEIIGTQNIFKEIAKEKNSPIEIISEHELLNFTRKL